MDLDQLPPQLRLVLKSLDHAMKSREPAFRRVPSMLLVHGSGRFVTRVLMRFATTGTAKLAARVVPLGVGIAAGAGFDWLAVTGLGRAAIRYYGPGGPGARPLLLAPEDSSHVELGG